MKALRNLMVPRIAVVLTVGLALYFGGCSQRSPIQPGDNETAESIATLHKRGNKKGNKTRPKKRPKKRHKKGTYPQFASRTFKYKNDQTGYQSGNMVVAGGSIFHLKQGALTPPPETPHGESVTLTMLVEYVKYDNDDGGKKDDDIDLDDDGEDENKNEHKPELRFTFGPSGSQFSPPAEVWFDWSDLGVRKAKLYYITNDDTYIELKPAKVDLQGHRFKFYIQHFSRYAVAWSN